MATRQRARSFVDNSLVPCKLKPRSDNENVDSIQKWISKQGFALPITRDPATRQASQVFQELIQTETQYVADLNILVNEFRTPIYEQGILSASELNSIFSNIHSILPTNEEFLERLHEIEHQALKIVATELSQLNNTNNSRKGIRSYSNADQINGSVALQAKLTTTMITGVSTVFSEFLSKQFKQYLVYCSGMGELHRRLEQLSQEKEEFDHFLRTQLQNPLCRMMDLHSFLVMPMQRITRYPMLLKEIQKCTDPMTIQHRLLTDAIQSCGDILSMINQRARIVQDLEKLVKITSQLYIPIPSDKQQYSAAIATNHGGISFQNLDLVNRDRKLLNEGPFPIISPAGLANYAFLFNDIIILSKSPSDKPPFSSVIRRVVDRNSIILRDETISEGDDGNYMLQLVEVGNQIIQISFSSRIQIKKWLKYLKTPVISHTVLPDISKAPRRVKSFYNKEKSSDRVMRLRNFSDTKRDKMEEKRKDEKRKEEKKDKMSNSTSRVSSKKGKSEVKRKSKTEKNSTSSIFSFWKTKTTNDVVRDSPGTPRSTILLQKERIVALEKEVKGYKYQCNGLHAEVADLSCQLQESQFIIKKLQEQLANKG